ncbi:hypothetical protein M413DRAFT_14385 [Hebeloma cylindrosporum]|uniref:Uncharacterized protein n=1 Tax=Hebeloma cylindrosporum TaxID=76867 RepID=A0A0C3BG61_HEBCY|nr:hypothetical protein M413DRAFT_14385 [Hebeloma cylindrosporum h7]
MSKDPRHENSSQREILHKAWEVQFHGVPTILNEVDVDRECLESLEEEMFENTDRTGASRNINRQWGLDAGHHQDGWNPYVGMSLSGYSKGPNSCASPKTQTKTAAS